MISALLVALGAGCGAVLRFLVASRGDRPGLPLGTLAVNVGGSLVLGALVGAGVGGATSALLATGFCGGLTTYSSFAVQSHGLGRVRGALYAAATLLGALAACAAGYGLARVL